MLLAAAFFGLIFGSFGTVLTTRLAARESIRAPRSHCRSCQNQLAWYENIPLFSYLILRARCRHCGTNISPLYPTTELATAALFVLVYAVEGLTPAGVALAGLAVVTAPLIIIDVQQKRLPNLMTLALILISLSAAVAAAVTGDSPAALRALLMSAILGTAFMIMRIASRGGMGLGDVKLVFGLGLSLGLISWKAPVAAIVISFAIAALVSLPAVFKRDLKRAIPFGPYLLIGAWIAVIGGATLNNFILGLWGIR